ncbi:MAG: DUF4276 family protein [Acidobacteria bacterium]|nr:DUF4276 family protein [Acidobacteriota bacterium]
MIEVTIVCEGQTEQAFVGEVLAPFFGQRRVFVDPRIIPTSPRAKGGALTRGRVLRYLRNTLRERGDTYVTTLFDLYGLTADFPGNAAAAGLTDPIERAIAIEREFGQAVVDEAGCRPQRFVPHIQPYEFESLLFSDVARFAEVEPDWQRYIGKLRDARRSAATPEHINHGRNTHPAARLTTVLHSRKYKKVLHGAAVSARIGIECIRAECRHFREWLDHVEGLPPLARAE